jgi:hypothetical protein
MITPTETETEIACEAMNTANASMFHALLVKVKASQDLASSAGVSWLRAFESETYAAVEYRNARVAWEATVITLIAAAQEPVK